MIKVLAGEYYWIRLENYRVVVAQALSVNGEKPVFYAPAQVVSFRQEAVDVISHIERPKSMHNA